MDKYEYKLRADEIKTLIGEGRYGDAVQIADTIDWKKVKSVRMLCTISDLYKINRRYEESREILLIANSRYPDGRYIIYSLCELSIKLQDIVHAVEYFKEFVRIAPHNTSRYILQYKLYVAQDVSLEERIAVLQEFKKHDYREKWGYELAFLYHRVGLTTECVEECDELFLWFGGGRFVMKALELKALHAPLSPEQKKVYERYKAGTQGSAGEAESYDDDRDEMGHDESAPQEPEDGEFHVKTVDVGQYNTINLQQVIADSLKELQKRPALQDTQVVSEAVRGEIRRQEQEEKPPLDNTADTGVLGITEEDLNAFEETDPESVPEESGTAEPAPDASRSPETLAPTEEAAGDSAFARSLMHTAASIATDDTIWMPSIPEMARYAAEQEEQSATRPEISERTIAQATGELPLAKSILQEAGAETPAEEALLTQDDAEDPAVSPAERIEEAADDAEDEPPVPQSEEVTAEKRLVDELQTEVGQARDEMRRLRAAERRAELRSREKNGGMREVSQDTRRLGQTREYVPIMRMDQAVQAALSDQAEDAQKPLSAPPEENVAPEGPRVRQVVRPNRKADESGYDDLLAQAPDGQIRMAVDEKAQLERQITGQISINEFLTGWENSKKDLQRRQMDGIREHVRQNTDELFREYDESVRTDLQHRLEEAQEEAIRREREEDAAERADAEGAGEQEFVSPERAIGEAEAAEPSFLEEGANAEPESAADREEGANESPAEAEREEVPAGPEKKHKPTKEEIAHQLAILEGRIAPDTPAEAPTSEADAQELKNAEGEAAQPLPDADAVEEAMQPAAEAPPEEADESAEQEAVGEETESAEDEAGAAGDGREAEGDEADDHVLRVMTPEEKELFGPYIHRKRSRRQIVEAIDSLSMAAYTGNVIITGEEGAGTINLAKGLIRSVQLSDANFSGQIAKISGRAMNRKRVDAIVEKLSGGALIIQGAAGMNNETTKALLKALQSENKGIIIVLEDTKKGVEKYLKKHPEIAESFTVRVDVEALATKELVAYAKQYARDREFSMDEFAVLALHKRIDEMQTAEHEVTIAEVRGIVDEAILRAKRKNPGHFFDILLQKRYDDDDMIILREKDFLR